MEAAKKALENSSELFPQLDYQKRIMAHSIKRQKGKEYDGDRKRLRSRDQQKGGRKLIDDQSNLPKQYRVREKSANDSYSSDSNSDPNDGALSSNSSGCSKARSRKPKQKRRHRESKSQMKTQDKKSSDSLQEYDDEFISCDRTEYSDTLIMQKVNDDENDINTDVSLESGEIL